MRAAVRSVNSSIRGVMPSSERSCFTKAGTFAHGSAAKLPLRRLPANFGQGPLDRRRRVAAAQAAVHRIVEHVVQAHPHPARRFSLRDIERLEELQELAGLLRGVGNRHVPEPRRHVLRERIDPLARVLVVLEGGRDKLVQTPRLPRERGSFARGLVRCRRTRVYLCLAARLERVDAGVELLARFAGEIAGATERHVARATEGHRALASAGRSVLNHPRWRGVVAHAQVEAAPVAVDADGGEPRYGVAWELVQLAPSAGHPSRGTSSRTSVPVPSGGSF